MSRRHYLAALLACGTTSAVVSLAARPEDPIEVARPITGFPRELGAWQGRDRELTERQYRLLETREVLFREYANPAGGEVLACVAVAGGNRKVAHPPEICYRGQGWTILDMDSRALAVGGAQRDVQVLRIEKDGRRLLVYSWYRVAARETASYLLQQLLGVWEDLKKSDAASALLRFSTPVEGQEWDAAEETLNRFVDDALPALLRALDDRAPGEAGTESARR